MTAFSEALRQEALHSSIRVTCVEPGFVDTELQGHNRNPVVIEGTEKMRDQIGEVLEAEDIADAIRLHRLAAGAREPERGADPARRASDVDR